MLLRNMQVLDLHAKFIASTFIPSQASCVYPQAVAHAVTCKILVYFIGNQDMCIKVSRNSSQTQHAFLSIKLLTKCEPV